MSEYIITDKQLKTATEAYLEHELSRPITEVFISGDKLPEIVRCRDCVHATGISEQLVCKEPCGDATASRAWCHPDGFCAWGERK